MHNSSNNPSTRQSRHSKTALIVAFATLLLLSSCRKEADYVPYTGENDKLAYSNYTEQFQYIWKCISTGYVFWDVDTVDWDAAYSRLLPRFEALDSKYADSGFVRTEELAVLYNELTSNLRDHHLTFAVRNLHPTTDDSYPYVIIRPGLIENMSRPYFLESRSDAQWGMRAFLAGLNESLSSSGYSLTEQDSSSAYIPEFGLMVHYHYCLFTLDDGRVVPYLWTSNAALTPVMRDMVGSTTQMIIDRWLSTVCNTPRNLLAGIILDNRSNGGGYQDDLDFLVGPFINERTEIFKTRYKEGPGRLEYSAWCPYYQNVNRDYHRDIVSEKIPYVILTDVNSVSMGEIEPMVIKQVIPTAYVIGERTFGGTGPLQNDAESLNYGAPFGDINQYHHYVYSSTFETLMDGKQLEGIGLVPDEEILRINDPTHSFKPQLDAAMRYIASNGEL